MKILLINDNPVVGKLVTLSAQKTGDELTSVNSMQEVSEGHYDLLIVDDASFDKEQLAALSGTLRFSKSCFIGSRTTERPEGFSHELNKPFLPTDLVDIFAEISSGLHKEETPVSQDADELDLEEDFAEGLDDIDDLDETLGDIEDLDDFEVSDVITPSEAFESDATVEDELEESIGEDEESEPLLIEDELVDEDPSETKGGSILDEEDVKEVQGLLDETDHDLLDDLEELDLEESDMSLERPLADEETLSEINKALEELDEVDEDEVISLDDALNELGIDQDISAGIEDDTIDESILDSLEEVLSDEFDKLDTEEDQDTDEADDLSADDLDALLEDDSFTDDDAEPAAAEEISEDLIQEDSETDEPEDLIADELLDPEEDEDAAVEEEDLIQEEIEEEGVEITDEDLSKLLSEAEEEDEEEEMSAPSEELDSSDELLDELLDEESIDEDLLDDALGDLILEDEDASESDGLLDEIAEEDEGDAELDALLEEIAEEDALSDHDDELVAEIESEDDSEEVDLSALNDEIKEALEGLDEDDLEGEIEDLDAIADVDAMGDIFSSLSSKDLKLALGEEIEEEIDEEEAKIQEEIEALESSLEEEEELEFKVGQSEYASLNEEALNEALGEEIDGDNEHPELEEVDAFVDAVEIEGAGGGNSHSATDENILALEELIATLKQANVKEALKGMKMNISISFNEKMDE